MSKFTQIYNNEAIKALGKGDNKRALSILRLALDPLLRAENPTPTAQWSSRHDRERVHRRGILAGESKITFLSESSYNQEQPVDQESFYLGVEAIGPFKKHNNKNGQERRQEECYHDQPYFEDLCFSTMMYNKAFSFSSYTPCSPMILRAILSYNVGLVLHEQSIQLGVSSGLPKALLMYKFSFHSLQKAYGADHTSMMKEVGIVILALLNNMADISQPQLAREKAARSYLEQMVFFLEYTIPPSHDEEDKDDFQREYTFFTANSVCLWRLLPSSLAPAA